MTWHLARHRTATAAAALCGLLIGAGLGFVGGTAASPAPGRVEVVLPDTDARLDDLVRAVRTATVGVHDVVPDRDLEVVFTTRLPEEADGPGLTGWQRGRTVWVRVEGNAAPTRTLLHELAHAVTPGDGHGETFRQVYLTALTTVFGQATAEKEGRRLAWVYDRCYRDGSCPVVRRQDTAELGTIREADIAGAVRPRARPPAPGER